MPTVSFYLTDLYRRGRRTVWSSHKQRHNARDHLQERLAYVSNNSPTPYPPCLNLLTHIFAACGSEMDGLTTGNNTGVTVLAATNRTDA